MEILKHMWTDGLIPVVLVFAIVFAIVVYLWALLVMRMTRDK